MRTQYTCRNTRRREAVRSTVGGDGRPVLNGIDFLEVASADQRTLAITFIHPLPGEADGVPDTAPLTAANVEITGGVRVTGIDVASVAAAGDVLTVVTDAAGDFSTYVLRITAGPGSDEAPAGIDPLLAEVEFSFKAACPSDFDCAPDDDCPPESLPSPAIDYLAKDYASFRRLMLDRLAATAPEWTERNAADVGVTVVELLAYAADLASWAQDAAATEAYLGTARRRTSLRRHARLLDYAVDDGTAARAWIALTVTGTVQVDGPRRVEDGASEDTPGTRFLTRVPGLPPRITDEDEDDALRAGAETFEALHALELREAWNTLTFYTWDDEDCCLPRGATRAFVRNPDDMLAELGEGRVIVFEETRGPDSGRTEDADRSHRHAVRITSIAFHEDPLHPETEGDPPGTQRLRVAELHWAEEDALPFPLCLRDVVDPRTNRVEPVSVVRANIVLADHGRTQTAEPLAPPDGDAVRYRPALAERPIVRQPVTRTDAGTWTAYDTALPAAAATRGDGRSALPAVFVRESDTGALWAPAPHLLDANPFTREFVLESEDDGSAMLRFGDGAFGRLPDSGRPFVATYRTGGGSGGNVGAESIAHVVSSDAGFLGVRNPLPAQGGGDPEPAERIRTDAPEAFRRQERAVTESDYAEVAGRHPEVQKAAATFRWTGSWHTVFVTVDRRGGRPVDAAFEEDLVRFLDRFSLAGYDLEIEPPRFVPLDIAFTVCVRRGHLRADVERELLDVFSSRVRADGTRGFFHPDNFTFGQPLYLSRLVAAAMAVPGVAWVDTDDVAPKANRFRRWGQPSRGETAAGRIQPGRLEILRLDNDASLPENGRLVLHMEGGL